MGFTWDPFVKSDWDSSCMNFVLFLDLDMVIWFIHGCTGELYRFEVFRGAHFGGFPRHEGMKHFC